MRFCGNCGLQLNWPTPQQTQPPPNYQQQGIIESEKEKPEKAKNPVVEGIRWIFFLFIMLPIFLGLLVWWYFRCFVAAPTGNTAFDIGRFIGGPAGLLLFGWLISWLTKKRDKGDSQG